MLTTEYAQTSAHFKVFLRISYAHFLRILKGSKVQCVDFSFLKEKWLKNAKKLLCPFFAHFVRKSGHNAAFVAN